MRTSRTPLCAIRILIAYATAGAGHRRAAQTLAETLRAQAPRAQVECVDILDDTPAWFGRFYAWSYLWMVRYASWFWRVSYAALDHRIVFACVQPIRHRWNLWIARRFARRLREQAPDVVITTHFLSADVCREGKRRGWLRAPVVVVVTDLHPHRFWLGLEFDAVVVGTEEAAEICVARGLDRARVHVLGIPVTTVSLSAGQRDALLKGAGLTVERQTVLLTSGGTTVGPFERVVDAVLALEGVWPGRLQLIAVCGEDADMRARLMARVPHETMPMVAFGFVENMAELMAASDLVVAKAGGLTVMEAVGQGKPLVLYHVIPGQERANAEYLTRHGAAVMAGDPDQIAEVVRQSLGDPVRRQAMVDAAGRIARPHAADEIVSQVILPLAHTGV